MKRLFWLLLLIASPTFAQYTQVQGFCQDGNQSVVTSGLSSVTKVQRSYPGCTVTVYNAGTTNLSTIYSDSLGTSKANPFTLNANGDGLWFFYGVASNHYDVKLSDGGIATPFTLTDLVSPAINYGGSYQACTLNSSTASRSITVCANNLPSTGGTVDARPLLGTQMWDTDAFSGITKPVDFVCGGATYTVSVTSTLVASVNAILGDGCIFSVNAGVTLTFARPPSAASSLANHFTGAGLVSIPSYDYPEWFGATGDGTTNDSAAIQNAMLAVNNGGGGVVRLTAVKYHAWGLLCDNTYKNVVLDGGGQGYSYSTNKTNSIISVNTADVGAVFAFRFKELSIQCGLQNLNFLSDGLLNASLPYTVTTAGVEYGVLIENGGTTVRNVTVHGFQYGYVIANNGNSNVFRDCSGQWNTKVGFAITPGTAGAYAAYHPNLTAPSSFNTTTIVSVENCNFNDNGWGIILRDGNPRFTNIVVESNRFGGVYAYCGTLDLATCSAGTWYTAYFEDNWTGYMQNTNYTITQNNLLQQTAGVWIPWTSNTVTASDDAGYQLNFGAVNSGNNGPNNHTFYKVILNGTGNEKGMYLKQTNGFKFYEGAFQNGDQTNFIRCGNGSPFLTSTTIFWATVSGTIPANCVNNGNRNVNFAVESSLSPGGINIAPSVIVNNSVGAVGNSVVVTASSGGYSTITTIPWTGASLDLYVSADPSRATSNLFLGSGSGIVVSTGLLLSGGGLNATTDYGAGQGRVVGIGGVTAANALTNSSMIRMSMSGGGNGQAALFSDASGNGRGEPVVIGMCTGGTCNALMEVGTRDTNTGGILIGQHSSGSLGTPPGSGSLSVENAIVGDSFNYIATETGGNNAIAGTLVYGGSNNVTLAAGLVVTVKLAHTLQAGANTFNFAGGGALSIKSHLNTANNIASGYASGGLVTLVYDGTQWEDVSQ